MIGRVLSDRYEVTELLGKGGMATVYKGVDGKLGRTVAIKVIHPGISADPKFAEHFITEGRNVAALNHPNVVGIYDIGEDSDTQYIVLEFVQGRTLRDILADGPLPLERALDYGRQLALGLAAAHTQGILHCDIKPQNVLVTDGGVAKLADFGISRAGASTGVVTGGMIMGTLDYLAPEQVEGKKPDEKTDIYALGLVIYEMLSGTLPFRRSQTPAQALAQRIVAEPMPLADINPMIPAPVAAAVMGALHKNPSVRFETAALLADALTRLDNSGQQRPSTTLHEDPTVPVRILARTSKCPRWKAPPRILLVGALALVVIGVIAGTMALSTAGPPSEDGGDIHSDATGGIRQLSNAFLRLLSQSTATPTPTATPMSTPTPTPVPTTTMTPTPHVVRSYPQRDGAGNTLEVQQWSDGRYTSRMVATAVPTPVVPYQYYGFRVVSNFRYPITLLVGDRLDGYFRDAKDNDITFWIEDPLGYAVYNPGKVWGTHRFNITAQQNGVYNLVFRNTATFTGRDLQLWWRAQ